MGQAQPLAGWCWVFSVVHAQMGPCSYIELRVWRCRTNRRTHHSDMPRTSGTHRNIWTDRFGCRHTMLAEYHHCQHLKMWNLPKEEEEPTSSVKRIWFHDCRVTRLHQMQSYSFILSYENLINFLTAIQVFRSWIVVKLRHLISTFETANYKTKARQSIERKLFIFVLTCLFHTLLRY